MPPMRLTMVHTGRGNAVSGTTPKGATLAFDSDAGGSAPTPMEHLLGAVGACALMDVEIILRKKRLAFHDLRVECAGERVEVGEAMPFSGVHLAFRVAGDVPPAVFEKAVRLSVEKYCSVGATIQATAPVTFEAVVEEDPPAP